MTTPTPSLPQAVLTDAEILALAARKLSIVFEPDEVTDLGHAIASLALSRMGGESAPAGLATEQEPKYTVTGSSIINRASGVAIPSDEPVFIFRARDVHAREALEGYACILLPGEHRDAVCQRVTDFALFATNHRARMKEPDTAAPTAPAQQAAPTEHDAFEAMQRDPVQQADFKRWLAEKDRQAAPSDDDEATQPWYDLAWSCGASASNSFAGDELEALTFSPGEFEKFCAALSGQQAADVQGERHA